MKTLLKVLTVVLMTGGAGGVAVAQSPEPASRQAFYGELHMHTGYSFDAYTFATRCTPEDAYEFAKGKPLAHPTGKVYQLSRPIDFMAVTDHGFYMGVLPRMADESHPLYKHPLARDVRDPNREVQAAVFNKIRQVSRDELDDVVVLKETWQRTIEAANKHYEPGKFTTFIGYEYTSTPDGQNLHRNVIFRGDGAPTPFTRLDSNNPEDLWAWLDKIRSEGHEALAIPHNSNLSDGRMFERTMFDGDPMTAEYAALRMRNEPLVEVTQVKGTSETHPMLSPNDEFADFELVEQRVASKVRITQFRGSYVRDAYLAGLEFQDKEGFNPYRFGLIGSSDSHTGIIPVEENNYSGKVGVRDGTPRGRLVSPSQTMDLRYFSASGLAAVWAEENTRESIYDALRRRETWAVSGPRIQVRFFGGFDFGEIKPGEAGWVEAAYAKGVPMGGELKAKDAKGAPTFLVWAMKDPESAHLDRIQIVKGWAQDGESHERVYDVVWSGGRNKGEGGKLEPVPNTVDFETLKYTNEHGAVELKGTWTDPDFDAKQNAFYYVRVLEIPTPRWSMFDAKELGIPHPADLKKTIQERAFTSPIWYDRD